MTMNPSATYLSKNGQTFGPYTEAELQAIESRGELPSYQWIWRTGDSGWKRLDLVPPPPPGFENTVIEKPVQQQVAVAAPATSTVRVKLPKTTEVLCYDRVHLINGELCEMDDRGAIFVVKNRETSPRFVKHTSLKLNLLDTITGQATERSASLNRVIRREGAWEYELRWTA